MTQETDWGHQATHPSYSLLRGEEGSLRWVACLGMSDEEIIARDKQAAAAWRGMKKWCAPQ